MYFYDCGWFGCDGLVSGVSLVGVCCGRFLGLMLFVLFLFRFVGCGCCGPVLFLWLVRWWCVLGLVCGGLVFRVSCGLLVAGCFDVGACC